MGEEKEIFFTRNKSLSLFYSAKSLRRREETEVQGYAVRVLAGGGLGFSYTEKEEDLGRATETARGLAKYSPRPNFHFPAKEKLPKLQLRDTKIAEIDACRLKEIFEKVREGAEKYRGNAQITMETNCSSIAIENTAGFSGQYETTRIQINIEVMDGNGFGFFSNAFPKLPKEEDFYKFGEEAAEMARESKNPKRVQNGKYIVAFEPDAFGNLIDVLLPSFHGELKKRKISYLHDKLGRQVFSDSLTITDDPLLAYGVNSQPFDDEGVPSVAIPLVEKGVVKNCIYNLEVASLEGVVDKGRCMRASCQSVPDIGFSNIVVTPGEMGDDEGELSVLSFHGTHTANTTTGDFGVEVNLAFLQKEGKREPVRDFMITGNIFNLFKNIYGIGKKQKRVSGFLGPRIAFSDVQVVR
ncbi:MAG: TldD/PmbA family protein [Candidatus Bilamarchaeaceae archaeon]